VNHHEVDHVLGVSRWLEANHFVIQHIGRGSPAFLFITFYLGHNKFLFPLIFLNDVPHKM
jgi:hypothetical protein